MLHSEDEWLQDQKGEIAAKIDRAFEQFERSEGLSPEQVRVEMEKRKAPVARGLVKAYEVSP